MKNLIRGIADFLDTTKGGLLFYGSGEVAFGGLIIGFTIQEPWLIGLGAASAILFFSLLTVGLRSIP